VASSRFAVPLRSSTSDSVTLDWIAPKISARRLTASAKPLGDLALQRLDQQGLERGDVPRDLRGSRRPPPHLAELTGAAMSLRREIPRIGAVAELAQDLGDQGRRLVRDPRHRKVAELRRGSALDYPDEPGLRQLILSHLNAGILSCRFRAHRLRKLSDGQADAPA
jgi:hypothetical protein